MIRLRFTGFTYEEMRDIIQLIEPHNTRPTSKEDECLVFITDEDVEKLALPMLIAMATIELDEESDKTPVRTGTVTRMVK